jgi:hypothetical protein
MAVSAIPCPRVIMTPAAQEACVKLKIFVVKSGNSIKKAGLEELETNVNVWLAEHPDVAIENTHTLGGPNLGWNLTALAVWYTEPELSDPTG